MHLTLTHEVSPQPPRVGPVTITLRLTDTSGTPVNGARITLEANMSHAGMTPLFASTRETEPGRYQSSMELSMAGDWFILVHVILPDGREFDRHFEIKGVAPVSTGRLLGVRRPGAALLSIMLDRDQSGASPPHSKETPNPACSKN